MSGEAVHLCALWPYTSNRSLCFTNVAVFLWKYLNTAQFHSSKKHDDLSGPERTGEQGQPQGSSGWEKCVCVCACVLCMCV